MSLTVSPYCQAPDINRAGGGGGGGGGDYDNEYLENKHYDRHFFPKRDNNFDQDCSSPTEEHHLSNNLHLTSINRPTTAGTVWRRNFCNGTKKSTFKDI